MNDQLTLNRQQTEAMKAVDRWIETSGTGPSDRRVFRLFGFAGTGKTTIARLLQDKHMTVYCAFTGKAADVLSKKGCPARTLHSLMYRVAPKNKDALDAARRRLAEAEAQQAAESVLRRLRNAVREEQNKVRMPGFMLNQDSDLKRCDLVVLDEASMVGGRLADDLLSLAPRVLALGDPAQLPPVAAAGYFTTGDPDYMLTEIVRQASESPILRIATDYRNQARPKLGDYGGGTRIVRRGTLTMSELAEFDQVLVGTNKTRRALNRQIRAHLGRTSETPVAGDRVVCKRNNAEAGLLNGSQWNVLEVSPESDVDIYMRIEPVGGDGRGQMWVSADKFAFTDPDYVSIGRDGPDVFDFAYAVTVHTAQGSEWERVFVLDESAVFRQDWWRWAYTAATRASDVLVVSQ